MLKLWDKHHPDLDTFRKNGKLKREYFTTFILTTVNELLATRKDFEPYDYYLFKSLKYFIAEFKLKSNQEYEIRLLEQDTFDMEVELQAKPVCPFKAKEWPSAKEISIYSWSENMYVLRKQEYHKKWLEKLICLLIELECQGWDMDILKSKFKKAPDLLFKIISLWVLSADIYVNLEKGNSITIDDIPWLKIQPAATAEAREIILRLKYFLLQYKYLVTYIF